MRVGLWLLRVGLWLLRVGLRFLRFGLWLLRFGLRFLRVGLWLLRFGLRFSRFGLQLLRAGFTEMRVGLWLVPLGLGFSSESPFSCAIHKLLPAVLAEPAAEERDGHLLGGKIQCAGQPQDGGGHGPGLALLDPVQRIGIQACCLGDRAACDAALQPEQLCRERGASCDVGLYVFVWRCHAVKVKRAMTACQGSLWIGCKHMPSFRADVLELSACNAKDKRTGRQR
jgi:hypothetical protein